MVEPITAERASIMAPTMVVVRPTGTMVTGVLMARGEATLPGTMAPDTPEDGAEAPLHGMMDRGISAVTAVARLRGAVAPAARRGGGRHGLVGRRLRLLPRRFRSLGLMETVISDREAIQEAGICHRGALFSGKALLERADRNYDKALLASTNSDGYFGSRLRISCHVTRRQKPTRTSSAGPRARLSSRILAAALVKSAMELLDALRSQMLALPALGEVRYRHRGHRRRSAAFPPRRAPEMVGLLLFGVVLGPHVR